MTMRTVDAIVTDIEGTTTSIAFVHDTLFPYAREHLPSFVRAHAGQAEVRTALEELKALGGVVTDEEAIVVALRFIDEDRKAGPLKAIQGLLWEDGYSSGAYVAHVFPDVAGRLRSFREAGIRLYVYSSGSVHAQKLLFGHTTEGDLTPWFNGYFDTTAGQKKESASYRTIAQSVGSEPSRVLFLSDVVGELDAARAADFRTLGLNRPGNAPQPPSTHRFVSSFDEIDPTAADLGRETR